MGLPILNGRATKSDYYAFIVDKVRAKLEKESSELNSGKEVEIDKLKKGLKGLMLSDVGVKLRDLIP